MSAVNNNSNGSASEGSIKKNQIEKIEEQLNKILDKYQDAHLTYCNNKAQNKEHELTLEERVQKILKNIEQIDNDLAEIKHKVTK